MGSGMEKEGKEMAGICGKLRKLLQMCEDFNIQFIWVGESR